MKKVAAIFLVCLYLVSFSGLALAADCKSTGLNNASINESEVCLGSNDHSGNSQQHPLQHFCKVIEVHKEVLASQFNSNLLYFPLPNISTVILLIARPCTVEHIGKPLLPGLNKIFLRNLRILIWYLSFFWVLVLNRVPSPLYKLQVGCSVTATNDYSLPLKILYEAFI